MDIFQLSNRELRLLIYLAKLRAIETEIGVTTNQIAERFEISQQTASRSLLHLNKVNVISWNSSPKGSKVIITQEGKNLLKNLKLELERALFPDKTMIVIRGTVFSGLGQGKYYISQPNYMKYFEKELGFKPYPGTLNLRVDSDYLDQLRLLKGSVPVIIEGFEEEDRSFGAVTCYPLTIRGSNVNTAGIIPRRTHYGGNTLEIISDQYLRKVLNINDGDEVIIEFNIRREE